MKSRTGFIQYLKFTAGSNKGGVRQGDLFNDPFKLGDMGEERVNYTSSAITESVTVEASEGAEVTLTWTPVVADAFGAGKTVKHIAQMVQYHLSSCWWQKLLFLAIW